jgi:hypothetical protein
MLACPLFLCNGDDSVCFFFAIIPMSLSWKVLLVHDLSNLACNYPIDTKIYNMAIWLMLLFTLDLFWASDARHWRLKNTRIFTGAGERWMQTTQDKICIMHGNRRRLHQVGQHKRLHLPHLKFLLRNCNFWNRPRRPLIFKLTKFWHY